LPREVATNVIEILCNGELRSLADGATVAALVAELGLNVQHVAVEVNQDLVPRAKHVSRPLAAGDRVEVVTLVGGG
jgi:sulfur carrier protein